VNREYRAADSNRGLAAKVDRLRQPQAYADRPDAVIVIETHMSWVFLEGHFAYKLKKPVREPFLDYSTLQLREHYCHEEVRLNRRLAPGVYQGVVPLTKDAGGQLQLDGKGEVVEWLVKMRRLHRDDMLDNVIRDRAPPEGQIRRIGEMLAAFYREQPAVGMSGEDYSRRCEAAVLLNQGLLSDPLLELPHDQINAVHAALLSVLRRARNQFAARAARIVEGHGDLRPEHICLETPPVIFDRLEFNREFRLLDPVDELSYLAMECERFGRAEIGGRVLDIYAEYAGDQPPSMVREYYMAYRASLRARLSAMHIRDRPRTAWPRWLTQAGNYLRIAQEHCRAFSNCQAS